MTDRTAYSIGLADDGTDMYLSALCDTADAAQHQRCDTAQGYHRSCTCPCHTDDTIKAALRSVSVLAACLKAGLAADTSSALAAVAFKGTLD